MSATNGTSTNGSSNSSEATTEKLEASNGTKEAPFTFNDRPTLEDIRKLHQEFSDERDWNQYHTPRNLLLALVGEVGELAELFQWRGECKDGLPDWNAGDRKHLEEELSDVLIYLIRLSDKCHINLPEAVIRKIELNKKKYPVGKVYGSCKKYNEYDSYSVNEANKRTQ